ncbi:MAG: DegT/DnrJ/EryC1/StrS family aminotransferase [Aureispira sp.]
MRPIQMVDLKAQHSAIALEVQAAMADCLAHTAFIGGPKVAAFQANLEAYLNVKRVVPCANGTDALQLALMSLDLEVGDEIIVPAFTYVATAEVIGLLRLKPVLVDVDPHTFNTTAEHIIPALTTKTKAIVPVHLFGQSADMEPILALAQEHNLAVIEDNAQAIGADYTFENEQIAKTGTLGTIGCTSFYPSKNLGAYGDGGALMTQNEALGERLRMLANHGQQKRYYHDLIGVNSRLDALQAAVLDIKLKHLDAYTQARQAAAAYYDQALAAVAAVTIPKRQHNSTHVFHQYTLKVPATQRDALQGYLKERNVPSMIYYPVPLQEQAAYRGIIQQPIPDLPYTNQLCKEVLSLPMHSELEEEQLAYIVHCVQQFFEN